MATFISPIVGSIAGIPFIGPAVTLFSIPLYKYGLIDKKQFLFFEGLNQGLWLIRYIYNKYATYQTRVQQYEKDKNSSTIGDDLRKSDNPGILVFWVLLFPWMILEQLFKTKKPRNPLIDIFNRTLGKIFLFGCSFVIFYIVDTIKISIVYSP